MFDQVVRLLPKRCFHEHGAYPVGEQTPFEGLDKHVGHDLDALVGASVVGQMAHRFHYGS
jgi:hypothetical protein